MAKRDWLPECNDRKVPPVDFAQLFCVRCRNNECTRAGYAGSLFADRVATQVDRLLLNPLYADLSMPMYARINEMDFPDRLREALSIEISRKRGDWEIANVDPEDAMKELIGERTPLAEKPQPVHSFEVTIQTDGEPLSAAPVAAAPPVVAPPPPVQVPMPSAPLQMPNTPFPVGGVMIDGSRPTMIKAETPKAIIVDPWASPAPATKPDNLVAVGAKIRMGLANAETKK